MKILVSVIAYNEEQNLEETLRDLIKYRDRYNYDIIVVDNGSTDNTLDICRSMNIDYVSHCINTGGSMGTIMTYLMYAYRNQYDIVCQFDGDGQHLAAELGKIIEPVWNGEADLAIGSRFKDMNRQGFQSYFFRRIGIRFFSGFISAVIKQEMTDVTSGFRAYGRKAMAVFAHKNRVEISDINQLILQCYYEGVRIVEVPVIMKERKKGVSEFTPFRSVLFPLKGLINIIGFLLQRGGQRY